MTEPLDPILRITAYLRAHLGQSDHAARIGPFLAVFDPHSDNLFRNYALPDDGADPSPAEIDALIAVFGRRQRRPRLEYAPALAPAVQSRLAAVGFTVESAPPLMVCDHACLSRPPPPPGFDIALALDDADLAAAAAAQNEAYGAEAVTQADIDRLRRTCDRGGAVVLARERDSGVAAGAGLFCAPAGGSTEVAAVGVRAQFRRRGIAAAVTAALAAEALARGIEAPFLMAAHEAEARLYGRVGFRSCGTMLHMSL